MNSLEAGDVRLGDETTHGAMHVAQIEDRD